MGNCQNSQVEGVKGADGNIKPLTWAKGYIDSWLNDHPEMQKEEDKRDMNTPLFCSIRKQDDGKRITGHAVYTMMQRLAEKVDIDDDRIHPHMLKHARGTFMRASPRFNKKDIEQVMDWSESTPMHKHYSHADRPSEAKCVASKMGVDVDIEEVEPYDCPRCDHKVPPAASYCPHCTPPLRRSQVAYRKRVNSRIVMAIGG